jgi:uncharacterized protein YecT (DUF1311 family)
MPTIQRFSVAFTLGVCLVGISGCGWFFRQAQAPDDSPSPTEAIAPDSPSPDPSEASPSTSPSDNAGKPTAPVATADCSNAATQTELDACAKSVYESADAKLNDTYQKLASSLNEGDRQLLTDAELAWIEFRDQNCDFEQSLFEGGSVQPTVYYSCLERMTKARTQQLESQFNNPF